MRRLWSLSLALLLFLYAVLGNCENRVCVNQSIFNPTEDLPYFRATFPEISIKAPTRNPYLGGRNQTYCCIRAVNDYLSNNCSNGDRIRVDHRILDSGIQFPCGALWNGDILGAPKVDVTYNWARDYCQGWQLSVASNVNEWAQLLASFILPSVVFSFNIPRPRKLKIWEGFFPKDIVSHRLFAGLGGAVGAAICVSIDSVVWLMISFAFAGPLLLSGLYEALLDKRVLDYLQKHIKRDRLPLGLQARILFTILCGNLDMYPAWSDTMDLAKRLDDLDKRLPELTARRSPTPDTHTPYADDDQSKPFFVESSAPASSRSMYAVTAYDRSSMASHEPQDTDPLRYDLGEKHQVFLEVPDRDHSRPHMWRGDSLGLRRTITDYSIGETERGRGSSTEIDTVAEANAAHDRAKSIKKITVRLRAMLSCQYSFGSTIGGPVVFFIGSFIYALLEIDQDTGDENIAEALAFGMWWTIIPHVAAVAGLLLAGNNPNILEGIVSIRDDRYAIGENLHERRLQRRATVATEAPSPQDGTAAEKKSFSSLMERVYEAEYTPAWMWDRGKCKQDWLLVLFTDSWLKYQRNGVLPTRVRDGLEDFLTDAVMLTSHDWIRLWSAAFLLIFVPCMFGFLTAYYTPEIGIGCRSITFLIYIGAQTLLLMLWTYYLTWRDKYWATTQKVKRVLQKQQNSRSESELEDLIAELKTQATRDTTVPITWRSRFGSVGPNDPDPLAARDKAHPIIKVSFYCLCIFGFLLSLLTSIGGTLMQIIGVYRNCLCLMKAPDWFHARATDTYLTLSTNTVEAIREARRDWIIIGASSVVNLGVVCYIGWWYQKRLRATFKSIAGQLGGPSVDREMM